MATELRPVPADASKPSVSSYLAVSRKVHINVDDNVAGRADLVRLWLNGKLNFSGAITSRIYDETVFAVIIEADGKNGFDDATATLTLKMVGPFGYLSYEVRHDGELVENGAQADVRMFYTGFTF